MISRWRLWDLTEKTDHPVNYLPHHLCASTCLYDRSETRFLKIYCFVNIKAFTLERVACGLGRGLATFPSGYTSCFGSVNAFSCLWPVSMTAATCKKYEADTQVNMLLLKITSQPCYVSILHRWKKLKGFGRQYVVPPRKMKGEGM